MSSPEVASIFITSESASETVKIGSVDVLQLSYADVIASSSDELIPSL